MFEAVVSKEGKVLTLSLRGECDLQTSPELAELITASIANGCSSLKIDLRGLTFIDSTGLRTLVSTASPRTGSYSKRARPHKLRS